MGGGGGGGGPGGGGGGQFREKECPAGIPFFETTPEAAEGKMLGAMCRPILN
jgi:hypothetical protein